MPGFSVIRDGDLAAIAAPLSFLGVNFYSPQIVADRSRIAAAREAGYWVSPDGTDPISADLGVIGARRPGVPRTQMGWEVEPDAITEVLARIHADYPPVPIYITENGAAFDDYLGPDGAVHDPERVAYINGHLRAVLRAADAGVNVQGYFVWSLLDNFEWAHGFSKRFGLVWVDFPTGARIPKDSFRWYQQTVRTAQLAPAPALRWPVV
jgi:beta-glucosidase